MPGLRCAAVVIAALTCLSGCADEGPASNAASAAESNSAPPAAPDDSRPMPVAAAFYPIAEAVSRVGGERVQVQNLTPPGTGPHDLELTPRQVEELDDARAVFYLSGGFQPQVADAVAQLGEDTVLVDVLDGVTPLPVGAQLDGTQGEVDGETLDNGGDPHIWVDPILQLGIAEGVARALSDLDPEGAAAYDENLGKYRDDLQALHVEYREGLATCRSRVIVTSHRAFEYLARRYGLLQIPIAGLSPENEPDPRSLTAIASAAEREGVRTVFFEEQVPADFAETVAREIGAGTDALDPLETITADDLADGASYISVMRRNLAALTAGLGCA